MNHKKIKNYKILKNNVPYDLFEFPIKLNSFRKDIRVAQKSY